ncbi:MAG TPA: deoxyribodipyrimidine photo-lyase [Acidobacteriota bacterium]|nr:deoxyribodipyrimidine photo-lyase [Acidobacteriota bacterium]
MAFRRVLHWFRRDFRLEDNTALLTACTQAEEIIPVYIFDPGWLSRPDASPERGVFLLDSLHSLQQKLSQAGSYLVVRQGDPAQVLDQLLNETQAEAIFANRIVDPYFRTQGRQLDQRLRQRGCEVRSCQDVMLHPPQSVLTKAGTPYTVFTPYKNNALTVPVQTPQPAPHRITTPAGIASEPIPTIQELGFSTSAILPKGGIEEAHRRLDEFAASRLNQYANQRDLPYLEGTSRLSPYLHFGCVSPRRVFWTAFQALHQTQPATAPRESVETWISELLWRDFYLQILYHFPHVETGAFKPVYNDLVWDTSEENFARWCQGQTGFPIVDAGMRQLNTTGWMHNRVRMIVASFLTKDLLINWQWGERYFMQHLVDGDLAANNGGWQWAASTGTDAQPYFRIFNPISQGQKFDPKGEYVRRYIPELKHVPEKWIHTPWDIPAKYQDSLRCRVGIDYPKPVVDHARQRMLALDMFQRVK